MTGRGRRQLAGLVALVNSALLGVFAGVGVRVATGAGVAAVITGVVLALLAAAVHARAMAHAFQRDLQH